MATIALVDDDGDVLVAVATMLEMEGFEVLTYVNGAAALDGFKATEPDLVILDMRMPQMDGVELLRRLRQKSGVPVILLTGRLDETDELLGLRIGADDFIRKPVSQRVLIERVRTVLRRRTSTEISGWRDDEDNVFKRGNICLDRERHRCTWKGKEVVLTATEFRLIEALLARPGVIKSRDALMDVAYDDDVFVDDRAIDTHIKRMRSKFRAVDEAFDRIETRYGAGYYFKGT